MCLDNREAYAPIHSSEEADVALRQLLAMHELARREHGERLGLDVYAKVSHSLHVQCGHPPRTAASVRGKVNNLKKRAHDIELFPRATVGAELYLLSAMTAAQIGDWLRDEVLLLPVEAIDDTARRLDGGVLRLLYSVAAHQGDNHALLQRLLRNLFGSSLIAESLCAHLGALRFPACVAHNDADLHIDEFGWPLQQ